MAEDDTLSAPDEGHVSEPDASQAAEPQEPVQEPQEPEPVQAPRQLTPEEIEERAFQRAASWMGRRESENTEKILRRVAEIVEPIKRSVPQQQAPAISVDPSQLLEKPGEVIAALMEEQVPRILQRQVTQETAAQNAFFQDTVRHAAAIMDSNPLFHDKTLGNEVVEEIKNNFGKLDRRLPPDTAAQLLVAQSYTNVAARRATTKTPPLAGNQPQRGIGTVQAPPAPVNAPKTVKLDADAKRIAEMFGNTDDEIRKWLG